MTIGQARGLHLVSGDDPGSPVGPGTNTAIADGDKLDARSSAENNSPRGGQRVSCVYGPQKKRRTGHDRLEAARDLNALAADCALHLAAA